MVRARVRGEQAMIPTRGKKSTSGGIQLTSNMEKPGRGILSPRSSATWQRLMETTTVLQAPMTSGASGLPLTTPLTISPGSKTLRTVWFSICAAVFLLQHCQRQLFQPTNKPLHSTGPPPLQMRKVKLEISDVKRVRAGSS